MGHVRLLIVSLAAASLLTPPLATPGGSSTVVSGALPAIPLPGDPAGPVLLWSAGTARSSAALSPVARHQEGNEESSGSYTPGRGFMLAKNPMGEVGFRLYTYIRYLNQKSLDATSVDASGDTTSLDRRQDIQLNKVNLQLLGWLFDPKFRYLAYVWTNNTAQGQTSQVVVGGNLTYAFNRHVTLGAGINALPGVRSTEGNFPYWLSVDNRQMATEYFRPSYTTGIWAKGDVLDGLRYQFMFGNNMSQLGIDAGQLDDGLNTIAAALVWYPTTGEFGPREGYGDLENHQQVATRFAVHYSRSEEDRQGQPNTDAFENVQIRISDGTVIFAPGAFGPGLLVENVTYAMTGVDAGVKYGGYSFDIDYYWRQLTEFRVRNDATLPFDRLADNGLALQASGMLLPETLQLYVAWSKIFGDYGDPWEFRGGVNYYPWNNRVVRANLEYIHLDRSPVGGLSLPYAVGSTGGIVYLNLEVDF
jgi:hypothetical protein